MRWVAMLVLAFLAGGCVTSPRPPVAASAAPEHTVGNVDTSCLRQQLESYTVRQGFVIRSSSDTRIVAGRIVHPIGPSLFSTRTLDMPEERVQLTLIPTAANGLRVQMAGGYGIAPGAGLDGTTPVALSADDVATFAAELDRMAAACPAKASG